MKVKKVKFVKTEIATNPAKHRSLSAFDERLTVHVMAGMISFI